MVNSLPHEIAQVKYRLSETTFKKKTKEFLTFFSLLVEEAMLLPFFLINNSARRVL